MSAAVSLSFRPALDGRAHRLTFRNAMRGPDGGEWLFLAEAFYLCEATACRGHWYDSRGETLPLLASTQQAALSVEWGDAGSKERGRTTYALQPDGRLAIRDEVQGDDGAWKVFGETSAERVAD